MIRSPRAESQNGWPLLTSHVDGKRPRLRWWVIPASTGEVRIPMRDGYAGFVLAHILLWFAERVEPLKGNIADDWGYAPRMVRGETVVWSNHASGTAADVNATKHVLGAKPTVSLSALLILRIRARLLFYRGVIRWGGDYQNRPDTMHFEINADFGKTRRNAIRLSKTKRGKRILAANSGCLPNKKG